MDHFRSPEILPREEERGEAPWRGCKVEAVPVYGAYKEGEAVPLQSVESIGGDSSQGGLPQCGPTDREAIFSNLNLVRP